MACYDVLAVCGRECAEVGGGASNFGYKIEGVNGSFTGFCLLWVVFSANFRCRATINASPSH